MQDGARRLKCSKCSKVEGVLLVYGFPGPELFEAEARGEIRLGGCDLSVFPGMDALPDTECRACEKQWYSGAWDDGQEEAAED